LIFHRFKKIKKQNIYFYFNSEIFFDKGCVVDNLISTKIVGDFAKLII